MAVSAASQGGRAPAFISALGGAGNLVSVDACTTRLRLVVADQGAVDEPALKALGARGVIRPSARDLQVVVGPIADDIAREMRAQLSEPGFASPAGPPAESSITALSTALLAALGGVGNVGEAQATTSRIRVAVADDALVDESALKALGVRGVARPKTNSVQVVLGPKAERVAERIAALATANARP